MCLPIFFYMKKFLIFLTVFISVSSYSQLLFHQDVFYGGVTATGISFGHSMGSETCSLYVEPGSTIRNAFLFSYWAGGITHSNHVINLNGDDFEFLDSDHVISFSHENEYFQRVDVYAKKINIQPNVYNYNVSIDWTADNTNPEAGQWTGLLYVEYDNPNLDKVATSLFVNDQDLVGYENYLFEDFLTWDTTNPIGLSLFLDRACSYRTDATRVTIPYENDLVELGEVWGNDPETLWAGCSGSQGHFYYQNETLFGDARMRRYADVKAQQPYHYKLGLITSRLGLTAFHRLASE